MKGERQKLLVSSFSFSSRVRDVSVHTESQIYESLCLPWKVVLISPLPTSFLFFVTLFEKEECKGGGQAIFMNIADLSEWEW